jgi:hypothetical protein
MAWLKYRKSDQASCDRPSVITDCRESAHALRAVRQFAWLAVGPVNVALSRPRMAPHPALSRSSVGNVNHWQALAGSKLSLFLSLRQGRYARELAENFGIQRAVCRFAKIKKNYPPCLKCYNMTYGQNDFSK